MHGERGALRRYRVSTTALTAVSLIVGLVVAIPAATAYPTSRAAATRVAATIIPPPIKHVWIITLENEAFSNTFGAKGRAQAPYLATTLPSKGALLRNYYATGHDSLDNYIAMVSGQGSNPALSNDCARYTRFIRAAGETFTTWTRYHQLPGHGCVFPKYVSSISTQLTRHGLTWKAYEQDMGKDPVRDKTTNTKHGTACGHPALGAADLTDSTAPKQDSYATRHDPFMYFRSITNSHAYCDAHVLALKPMTTDLKRISTTPNYSFITPDTCADGHDFPKCHDGTKGGLARANTFLKNWIPLIRNSAAYKANGLIVITFDEAEPERNAVACCGEVDSVKDNDPSHPNIDKPGVDGPGGGRVGAVALSPFIQPGTVSTDSYNHYSLLRSIEDIFGLRHLGDAEQPKVKSFGADVYTNRP